MPEDSRWNSLALRLVLGLTALRLLWHLLEPVGLLGDEAYYWEWGRRLDWGYFSKPPLIGWLYGALGRLTGDSLYAFKATATLLTGGALWFFYLAVRRIFDAGVAFWALAASALTIGNTLLASILTIDAPLLFFWCLALWLYFRILLSDRVPGWTGTLLLAGALGLGHLSKQMMLLFPPLMLAGAWFVRRDLLKKPHLYVASVLSLLFLFPTLHWNLEHDWVTVSHTGHHFESAEFDPADIAVRFLTLAGITAVLLTPILLVLILGAIWSMRRWSEQPSRARLLFVFGPLALLGIAVLALRQNINPNWPAVFYPAAIALTTWWCLNGDGPKRAVWLRRSVALGAALTFGAMILIPLVDHLGIPAQRRGWRGYEQLAAEIERDRLAHDGGPSASRRTKIAFSESGLATGVPIVVQGHRFNCSQIAYHLRDTAQVFRWPDPDRIDSQYDFWPGPQDSSVLLVIERKNERRSGEPSPGLAAACREITFVRELALHPSRDFPRFRIYRAYGLDTWPSPVPKT